LRIETLHNKEFHKLYTYIAVNVFGVERHDELSM